MECGTTIQVMTVIVIKLYRLQFQTPQLLLAIRKQTMSKLRPIEEVIHTLIETGKGRADFFEPDAEVILATTAEEQMLKLHVYDRHAIHTLLREGVEQRKCDDICGSCDGTAVNTLLRNGEDCPHCHGTGVDSSCYTQNYILDDILTLIDELFSDKTETSVSH